MAFCGKMHDSFGFVLRQQCIDARTIADIGLHKNVARIVRKTHQIFGVARIGELIDINHRRAFRRNPVEHKI